MQESEGSLSVPKCLPGQEYEMIAKEDSQLVQEGESRFIQSTVKILSKRIPFSKKRKVLIQFDPLHSGSVTGTKWPDLLCEPYYKTLKCPKVPPFSHQTSSQHLISVFLSPFWASNTSVLKLPLAQPVASQR